jgi:hypothetical protein
LTSTVKPLQCRGFSTKEKVMKAVASTDEYTVYQRRDGRYAVKGADKKPINGDAKVAILLQHDLIKAPAPKAPEPEPEVEAEAAAPESTEGESPEGDAAEAESTD